MSGLGSLEIPEWYRETYGSMGLLRTPEFQLQGDTAAIRLVSANMEGP